MPHILTYYLQFVGPLPPEYLFPQAICSLAVILHASSFETEQHFSEQDESGRF